MTDPDHVLVAGDWHGNTEWAVGVIDMLPDLLPDEHPRRIVHLGDFGIWPGRSGDAYLRAVNDALIAVDGELWFVDGNHEDHRKLRSLLPRDGYPARVPMGSRVSWLSRGHRWTWHNRWWMALGGAASVDRLVRKVNVSWWPDELLSDDDVERAAGDGPADVIVAHDCPSSVPLDLPRPAPRWWDLDTAERHRRRVQEVVDKVTPTWLMHGHYHLFQEQQVPMPHGEVRVTGFNCDEALTGNYRILDVRDMTWGTTR